MTAPSVYDHVRPTTADYQGGIYRVVGTDESGVTLLRVSDADGRRANTGQVVTVEREALDEFEPAENPDERPSLLSGLASAPGTIYWTLRAFGGQVRQRPLQGSVALVVAAVGIVGEELLSLSPGVATALTLAGGLGLALVGSGRL